MVELLLLGHHGRAGLRYGDAHVNLCVMLAANLWREQGGLSGVFALMFQRSESLPRKTGQAFLYLYLAACSYLPQKDRK